jgi:hypothetical protein
MKTIPLIAALVLLFVFDSCKKSTVDNTNNNNNTTTPNLTVSQNDSTSFSAVGTNSFGDALFSIKASTSDGKAISITINNVYNATAGTFPIISGQGSATFTAAGIVYSNIQDTTNKLVISAVDYKNQAMSGSFSYKATGTNGITRKISGTFTNIKFTLHKPSDPNNTYTANVNSKLLNAATTYWEFDTSDKLVACMTDGSTIILTIPHNPTGTNQIGAGQSYMGKYISQSNTGYDAYDGTFTISSFSLNQMKSTFSFSAANPSKPTDVIKITSGAFSVWY